MKLLQIDMAELLVAGLQEEAARFAFNLCLFRRLPRAFGKVVETEAASDSRTISFSRR